MRKLGLMGKRSWEKFIPDDYLYASESDRKYLLAGLMDTDGTSTKTAAIYTTTSSLLAYDVVALVNSLGGKCSVAEKEAYFTYKGDYKRGRNYFEINIFTSFNPFRLKRKADNWKLKTRCKKERVITRMECVGKKRSRCLSVSSLTKSFLCTENYIVTHNSSTMIRKSIEWSTNTDLWKELWAHDPSIFWYFYPTMDIATIEVQKKWVPKFLPRGPLINSPTWGYELEYDSRKKIYAVHYNTKVSTYFKSYEFKGRNLQAATVDAIFCDEECPDTHFGELLARLTDTDGYYHNVFTFTDGYEYLRRTMEEKGDLELNPEALKLQVSLYD